MGKKRLHCILWGTPLALSVICWRREAPHEGKQGKDLEKESRKEIGRMSKP